MRLAKRIFKRFYKEFVIFKITIGKWFGGIEYVSRQITSCPSFIIADLLKRNGAIIGENVSFKDTIQIDNATGDKGSTGNYSNLIIKEHCYIGKGVFFDLPAKVILEKECVISAGVKFLTHQDCGNRLMSKYYPRQINDVKIGVGTWIGANAVILNGVTIGEQCVIGAGAVVLKDVPAHSVAVGVPARVVKELRVTKK